VPGSLSGQDCHANDRSAPADSPQPDDSLRPRNRPPCLSCPGSFSEVPCLSTGRGTRALPPEKKWNHWGEPWIVDSESPSCDRMRSFSRTVMESPLQLKARPVCCPQVGTQHQKGGACHGTYGANHRSKKDGVPWDPLLCKNKCGKTLSISPLSAPSLSQAHQIRRHILVMIERLGHCISQIIFYQKAGRTVWSLDRYAKEPMCLCETCSEATLRADRQEIIFHQTN